MVEEYQQAVSMANLGGSRDVQGVYQQLGLKNSPQVLFCQFLFLCKLLSLKCISIMWCQMSNQDLASSIRLHFCSVNLPCWGSTAIISVYNRIVRVVSLRGN